MDVSYFLDLYHSSGGLAGMAASLLFLVPTRLRCDKPVVIGITTIAFNQLVHLLFETYAHSAYLNDPIAFWYMTMLTGLFFIAMLFFYPRINSDTKGNHTND